MSYTNSTPNYGLPQYVADDKPTYLGDFNKAMLDIDTDMKTIDNKAISAVSTANSANANASEALETATTASSTASSAQTKADSAYTMAQNAGTTASNAQSLASTANTNSQNAVTTAQGAESSVEELQATVTALQSKLNNIGTWKNAQIVNTAYQSNSSLTANFNPTLKILNVFGRVTPNAKGPIKIGQLPASFGLTPLSKINVEFGGMYKEYDQQQTTAERIVINQDGSIDFPAFSTTGNIEYLRVNFMLCVADTTRWQITE